MLLNIGCLYNRHVQWYNLHCLVTCINHVQVEGLYASWDPT